MERVPLTTWGSDLDDKPAKIIELLKKIRRQVIYWVLGRLTNTGRVFFNKVRRRFYVLENRFKPSMSYAQSEVTHSRIFVNICIPDLYFYNSYPGKLKGKLDRLYLVEEYFPGMRRSLGKRKLERLDIFNLHFIDQMKLNHFETLQLIDELRTANIKIVLTAHDLTPHSKQPEIYDQIFQAWFGSADGIIHHSRWGMATLLSRYQIPESTKHAIIYNLGGTGEGAVTTAVQRAGAEAAFGLNGVPIRIGIVGQPRRERLVAEFLEGFSQTLRHDMEIACWSLSEHDVVPNDPRIVIAEKHKYVLNRTMKMRLRVCDVISIPYQEDGEMLTTGVITSAVEAGIGILRTDWPFLKEVAGDVGIYIGSDVGSFTAGLSHLTVDDVERAKRASLELRRASNWRTTAQEYGKFYESVLES
jgi:hypothetical protein